MNRFPVLRERLYQVVNKLLRNCMVPTQNMIGNLIDVELSYINTSHPDFISGREAIKQVNEILNSSSSNGGVTAAVPVNGGASTEGSSKEKVFSCLRSVGVSLFW